MTATATAETTVIGTLHGRERTVPLDLYAYKQIQTNVVGNDIPAEFAPFIEDIFVTYLFDKNLQVRICSFDTYYEGQMIQAGVDFKGDPDDDMREKIYAWWTEGCLHDGLWEYFMANSMDKEMEAHPDRFHAEFKSDEIHTNPDVAKFYADMTLDEIWDNIAENMQGNWRF